MQSGSCVINGHENRQSCFELLRLIAMFFIVLYHLLLWFVQDNPSHDGLKALWLPLHVGVICFVLISGYFRIKPSSKGFIKLLVMVLIYSLPGMVVEIKNAGNWHDIMHSLMFVSHTEYWFVRTYFGLYLLSPLINSYFDHSSLKHRWYMLIITGIISVYLGNFAKYYLYLDGKNLVNFLFLYQIGQMLFCYSDQWRKIKLWKLLIVYGILNLLLVVGFHGLMGTHWGDLVWRFSFPYSSPILIVNAILLFVIIGHFSFTSPCLNRLSSGVFAVYLIHGSVPLITDFQRNIVSAIFPYAGNYWSFVGILVIMSVIVILLCLLINKLLSPVWKLSSSMGNWVYGKIGF